MINLRSNSKLFWNNGEFQNIQLKDQLIFSIENPVYEVLRYKNKLYYYDEHIKRLNNSLSSICSEKALLRLPKKDEIEGLFMQQGFNEGNVRIDVFCHSERVICYLIPYFYPPHEWYIDGVSVSFQHAERQQQNIKIYRPELKNEAQEIIKKQGVFETLLVNRNGGITEGSRSNVFFISGNQLITAPSQDVLEGITRQKMLDFLTSHQFKIEFKALNINDINKIDAGFLTGTSIGALPINRIENHMLNMDNLLLQKIVRGFMDFERL